MRVAPGEDARAAPIRGRVRLLACAGALPPLPRMQSRNAAGLTPAAGSGSIPAAARGSGPPDVRADGVGASGCRASSSLEPSIESGTLLARTSGASAAPAQLRHAWHTLPAAASRRPQLALRPLPQLAAAAARAASCARNAAPKTSPWKASSSSSTPGSCASAAW
eukprot:43251-Chlamydomonas_euryale.AAC.8